MEKIENPRILMSSLPIWASVPPCLKKRVNPNFTIVRYDDAQMMEDFAKLTERRIMYTLTNSYRAKLDEFVTRSGSKGAGLSNVNILGLYQTGEVPKKDDLQTQLRRARMQDNYAEAIAAGITDVYREMGFTPNSKHEYPDYNLAKLAIEMESLSSKGPYDRGSSRTAYTVEENNLKDAYTDFEMDEDQLLALALGLDVRRGYYVKHPGIKKSKRYEPWNFADVMQQRGIGGTYRGGFNASGDSTINLSQIAFSSWIFEKVRGLVMHEVHDARAMWDHYSIVVSVVLPSEAQANSSQIMASLRAHLLSKYVHGQAKTKDGIPEFVLMNRDSYDQDGHLRIKRLMTVDEFMSSCAYDMFKNQNLSLEQIINLAGPRLNVMGNLQRDQGSPYIYEWSNDRMKVSGRKDRKYRMVIPVMAWVQMFLIAALDEILDAAVDLPGRVGLAHPSVNEANMRAYLKESFSVGCFNDSFDLTRFDAGIIDQAMNLCGLMYASLYDDPNVKCALSHIGWWSMDKYMIMAKPTKNADPIWDKYAHIPLKRIKGNKTFAIARAAQRTGDAMLRREAEAQLQRSYEDDYEAVLLHVRRSWEPSGIFTTNLSESDINFAIHKYLVWLELLKIPRVAADPNLCRIIVNILNNDDTFCQTSGDDIILRIPIELLDYASLDEIRELFAMAYSAFNWTMNWKKMSKVKYQITYNGKVYMIPMAEFLQWLYPQHPDVGCYEPRRKFCRAWPSLGYTERNSKLPLPMQYTSVDGRLNTALTSYESDLDFAARLVVATGRHLKSINKRNRTRVLRSKGVKTYIDEGKDFFYNTDCEAGYSELCGLDDYFAYVKKYGDEFVGELSKKFAEIKPEKMVDYADAFAQELETRAPHRTWLIKALMTQFSKDEFERLFGKLDIDSLPTVKPVVRDLVAAIEKLGVTITPKIFPDDGSGQISDGEIVDDVLGKTFAGDDVAEID